MSSRTPAHVTLRVLADKSGLRRRKLYALMRASMRSSGHRDDFRICHYSVQGNHLHLLCEADSSTALARGVQGFSSSIARKLNRARGRTGRVFADRYHVHVLRSPTEVRHALGYVLNNWRRHGEHRDLQAWKLDPYSSADLFDGYSGWYGERHAAGLRRPLWLDPDEPIPIAAPRSWLLRAGWRRLGTISIHATPGPA